MSLAETTGRWAFVQDLTVNSFVHSILKNKLRGRGALGYGLVMVLGLCLGMMAEHVLDEPAQPKNLEPIAYSKPGERANSEVLPPWGCLEINDFPLEISDELLPPLSPELQQSRWWFPDRAPAQVAELFRSCGLEAGEASQLLEGAEWEAKLPGPRYQRNGGVGLTDLVSAGVWVLPNAAQVLALPPGARQRLYPMLAQNDQNSSQRGAFRFAPQDWAQRLLTADLPADKVNWVQRMAYTNEGTVCLADLEALRTVFTTNEQRTLLKILYRTPTLLLRVRISSESDVDRLARYWGPVGRAWHLKPFLTGLTKSPGAKAISVSFFMPAFARTRLYTFPDPATHPAAPRQDCLWTALNFFNEQPDDRYLQSDYAERALRTQYETNSRAPAYGDVIALANPGGGLVHLSVFLADDIVFTKNGAGSLQPWVLMRLPEMVMRFRALGPVVPVIYHRKAA